LHLAMAFGTGDVYLAAGWLAVVVRFDLFLGSVERRPMNDTAFLCVVRYPYRTLPSAGLELRFSMEAAVWGFIRIETNSQYQISESSLSRFVMT
jgi:hypothetical protein